MARGNLAAVLAITLKHEGGYSTVRSDPGNWTGGKVGAGVLKGTKYGISAKAYPNLDIKNLTLDDVKPIYEKKYWRPVAGENLPFGVDLATFDAGVMSGPSRGVRWLQAAIGERQDGKAGTATINAAAKQNGKETIQRLCAKRLGFVQSLKTWATFGKGWGRRIADIEAQAVAMWLARGGALTESHRQDLRDEGEFAGNEAEMQGKVAGGAGGGGVVVGGGDTILNGGAPNWIVVVIAALVVVGAIVLVIKSRQNKDRAAAYAAVANSAV